MLLKRRDTRLLALIVLIVALAFALTACDGGGSSGDDGGDSNGDSQSDPQPEPSPTPALIDIEMDGTPGVLAWVGDGRAPGRQSLSSPGDIVLIDSDGDLQTLISLPEGTTRVYACGDQATSSDGRYFGFYVGADVGMIYLADGADNLYTIREIDALGCLGAGAFQFSTDGDLFAYIDFDDDAQTDPVAQGALYIHESDSRDDLYTSDAVAAFDMSATQVAYIGMFGDYTEAALTIWEDGETDEVGTFFADSGCAFTGGQVALLADDAVAVILGERCDGVGTRWTLHSGDISGGGVSRLESGRATGSYFSESRTAALYGSADGTVVYYAIPNGIARNLVNIRQIIPAEPAAGDDLVESAVMPRLTTRLYNPDDNASPVISPDGRWAAVVSNSTSSNVAMNVFDLVDPSIPPLVLNPVARGDTISSIAFTADSSQLLFVAGGSDSDTNSLFSVTLATGVDERLARGRFGQVVSSADSTQAIVSEWQVVTDPNEPPYLDLRRLDLADPDVNATLFEGADVIDGAVENQRFIYPLSWLGMSESGD